MSHNLTTQLLTPDILSLVIQHLPPESIVALSRTCHHVHDLVQSSSCWKHLCTEYIDHHCRSQERGVPVRLEVFDVSDTPSWWRLWSFLKRHESLMGFWALQAPTYGRVLAVRVSPITGKITCEALVQSVVSEAAREEFLHMRNPFNDHTIHHVIGIPSIRECAAVYLISGHPENDGRGLIAYLHDPSISSTLAFTIIMDNISRESFSAQHLITYWRDRTSSSWSWSEILSERTKPLQLHMTDLRPLPPLNSDEYSQSLDLHKALPTHQNSWQAMCPPHPSNPRSAQRVIKDLDFGFRLPQPQLCQVDHLYPEAARLTGRKQYERGHYRPICAPRDAAEAAELFQGCQLAALGGLWVAYYAGHGPEVLYFRPVLPGAEAQGQSAGQPRVLLEAIKLIGDANVICGEVSFQITPTAEEEAQVSNIPEQSRPLDMPPWPLRFEGAPMGPVYTARGQIAQTGFQSPGWIECRVGITSVNQIAVHWTDMSAVTCFTRMTGL